MNRSLPTERRLFTPALLAMVALSMSATAVVEGAGVATPRAEVRATAQEQTDAILRVVSEAARQLCGADLALIGDRPVHFIAHADPLLWVVVDRGAAHPPLPLHILPSLIDLPPPLC